MHRVTVPLLLPIPRVLLVMPWGTVPAVILVVVWPKAMMGSSASVVGGRWLWLVVWSSAWTAGAGYLRCPSTRGCAGGGGLSVWWRWQRWLALWSWCRRSAVACVRGWVPLCVAVAVGVGALGAWWAWLGVGARVNALLAWAVWG